MKWIIACAVLITLTGCKQFLPKEPREREREAAAVCPCDCQKEGCQCPETATAKLVPVPLNDPLIDIPRSARPSALAPQPSQKITGLTMPGGKGVCPACDASAADLKAAGVEVDWQTPNGATPSGWFPHFVWIGRDGKQYHWTPPTHQWLGQTSVNALIAEVNKTR